MGQIDIKAYKANITDLLKRNNGRLIDIAYKANEIILKSGDFAPELLQFFFEKEFSVMNYDETEDQAIVAEKDVKRYITKYAEKIWSWLDNVLENRPSTTDFYKSLYNYLNDKTKWKNENIRAFVFLTVWIDPRIPYYRPESGIKIDEDEFVKITKKISKARGVVKTVIFTKYSLRTEEASVLLKQIEGLATTEEKAVLLAYIIKNVEFRTLKEHSEDRAEDE